jgi:hypothetical protein
MVHLIEPLGEVRDRLSFLSFQRSELCHVIHEVFLISSLSQESIIQNLYPIDGSRRQGPKPLPSLTFKDMNKNHHPYVCMHDDMLICETVKGFKVLFCSYISFAYKLGHLLEVAIYWKGIERLRQYKGSIPSSYNVLHPGHGGIRSCHRDIRWRRNRRRRGSNKGC